MLFTILALLISLYHSQLCAGKVFDRCELAQVLHNRHGLSLPEVANWVCIAQHSSGFNTGAYASGLAGGSHGLFQISDVFWCAPPGKGFACNIACEKLRDDDLTDDLACSRIIFNEHQRISGDGFSAWNAYEQFCKQNAQAYINGCFGSQTTAFARATQFNTIADNSAKQTPAKIYDRCELASELYYDHSIPIDELATWVCIAQHESQYDTSAVGRRNADGSLDHGLFQISDLYWCTHSYGIGKDCGVNCNKFLDTNITDDVRCARRIHREHTAISGDGFTAWTVYDQYCRDQQYEQVYDCFYPPDKQTKTNSYTTQKSAQHTSLGSNTQSTHAVQKQQHTGSHSNTGNYKSQSPQQYTQQPIQYSKKQQQQPQIASSAASLGSYTSKTTQSFTQKPTTIARQPQINIISNSNSVNKQKQFTKQPYQTQAQYPSNTVNSVHNSQAQKSERFSRNPHQSQTNPFLTNSNTYHTQKPKQPVPSFRQQYQSQNSISSNTQKPRHSQTYFQSNPFLTNSLTPTTTTTHTKHTTGTQSTNHPPGTQYFIEPQKTNKGKVYKRCELAQEMYFKHKFPMQDIATWVCIAQHESNFDTSAVGRLNSDGSADHGLFQISDLYWCSHGGSGKACGLDCNKLLNNDITDDIKCLRKIHDEHTRISGNGYTAWTVYQPHCRGQVVEQISNCFDSDTFTKATKVPTPTQHNPVRTNDQPRKVYSKCTLAQELFYKHKLPMEQIATWVCIAQHESNFDTSAVGRLNADGSADHGLFQISDLFWCSHDAIGGKACNLPCSKLLDNDITDDVRCIKIIHDEHTQISGDGFNAWTVYKPHCFGKRPEQISECFNGEETSSTQQVTYSNEVPQIDCAKNTTKQATAHNHLVLPVLKEKPDKVVLKNMLFVESYKFNPFLKKFFLKTATQQNSASVKKTSQAHNPTPANSLSVYQHNPFLSKHFLASPNALTKQHPKSQLDEPTQDGKPPTDYSHNPFLYKLGTPKFEPEFSKPNSVSNFVQKLTPDYRKNPFLQTVRTPQATFLSKASTTSTTSAKRLQLQPSKAYLDTKSFRRNQTRTSTTTESSIQSRTTLPYYKNITTTNIFSSTTKPATVLKLSTTDKPFTSYLLQSSTAAKSRTSQQRTTQAPVSSVYDWSIFNKPSIATTKQPSYSSKEGSSTIAYTNRQSDITFITRFPQVPTKSWRTTTPTTTTKPLTTFAYKFRIPSGSTSKSTTSVPFTTKTTTAVPFPISLNTASSTHPTTTIKATTSSNYNIPTPSTTTTRTTTRQPLNFRTTAMTPKSTTASYLTSRTSLPIRYNTTSKPFLSGFTSSSSTIASFSKDILTATQRPSTLSSFSTFPSTRPYSATTTSQAYTYKATHIPSIHKDIQTTTYSPKAANTTLRNDKFTASSKLVTNGSISTAKPKTEGVYIPKVTALPPHLKTSTATTFHPKSSSPTTNSPANRSKPSTTTSKPYATTRIPTTRTSSTVRPYTTIKSAFSTGLSTTSRPFTISRPSTTNRPSSTSRTPTTTKISSSVKPYTTSKLDFITGLSTTSRPFTISRPSTTSKPSTTSRTPTTTKISSSAKPYTTSKSAVIIGLSTPSRPSTIRKPFTTSRPSTTTQYFATVTSRSPTNKPSITNKIYKSIQSSLMGEASAEKTTDRITKTSDSTSTQSKTSRTPVAEFHAAAKLPTPGSTSNSVGISTYSRPSLLTSAATSKSTTLKGAFSSTTPVMPSHYQGVSSNNHTTLKTYTFATTTIKAWTKSTSFTTTTTRKPTLVSRPFSTTKLPSVKTTTSPNDNKQSTTSHLTTHQTANSPTPYKSSPFTAFTKADNFSLNASTTMDSSLSTKHSSSDIFNHPFFATYNEQLKHVFATRATTTTPDILNSSKKSNLSEYYLKFLANSKGDTVFKYDFGDKQNDKASKKPS